MQLTDPRGSGREAIKESVGPHLWEDNVKFTHELKEMIEKHRLFRHPVIGLFETEKLSQEITRTIHLEFAYAFAQIFTDSLIYAMARTSELEPRLGPAGKVSARFLLQLNLLDELGYQAAEEVTGDYCGHPKLAHYMQFAETLKQLGAKPGDILTFKPSPAATSARKTFTDHYEDYTMLAGVLACAEQVFTRFAGPWAKSVAMSTSIDTSKGYHNIHVEQDDGSFIDDDHSEDSWYIFRQAITPDRYQEVRERVEEWLDVWNDFADNIIHVARTLNKK